MGSGVSTSSPKSALPLDELSKMNSLAVSADEKPIQAIEKPATSENLEKSKANDITSEISKKQIQEIEIVSPMPKPSTATIHLRGVGDNRNEFESGHVHRKSNAAFMKSKSNDYAKGDLNVQEKNGLSSENIEPKQKMPSQGVAEKMLENNKVEVNTTSKKLADIEDVASELESESNYKRNAQDLPSQSTNENNESKLHSGVESLQSVAEKSVAYSNKQRASLSLKSPFVSTGYSNKKNSGKQQPLKTADEVVNNKEALQRIREALAFACPGVVFRWKKMLQSVNRSIESTKENPNPLLLDLSLEELKKVLNHIFENLDVVNIEGMLLMREYLPKLYNKHNFERGKRVSQQEREKYNINDPSYAYGELSYEIFATLFLKIITAYGIHQEKGYFVDLGSGVGQLVYTAAFLGTFQTCVGIEMIDNLIERGRKRLHRWDRYSQNLSAKYKEMKIEFIKDNIFECDFYATDASFIFLHWTAFTYQQKLLVSDILNLSKEGTICVTLTIQLMNDDYELLRVEKCETSWGITEAFIHEKMTPSKTPNHKK
jgi:hypothetical protein